MRANLVPSALTVFGFWWLILAFNWITDSGRDDFTKDQMINNSSITLMSVLWGIIFSVGVFLALRFFSKSHIEGSNFKGMSVNIGPFPKNRIATPRAERVTPWHPLMAEWVSLNREKHLPHYRFLEVVAEILDAHPLHPASIEPGGHGDRTLVDHSHFVAEYMLKHAATYVYKGLKEPGSQSAKTIDPLYKFNSADILIPLVGLVHDIGKIECYEVTHEGIAQEKRAKHDWRGRFVLTGLPEFWDLPADDQETLLDVVGYYHHPWAMPLGVTDRARSLIELVMQSDLDAGEFEAKYPRLVTKDDKLDMVRRMLKAKGEDPEKATLPDRSLPYELELDGKRLSLHQSRLLYFFEHLMFDKGSINGENIDKRIGLKIGRAIYLNEEAVREKLGAALEAKRLIDLKKIDGQKVLTTRLLEVMSMRKTLVRSVSGHTFAAGKSLFRLTTRTNTSKGKREMVWPSVFIIDSKAYADHLISDIPEIDHTVVSITPVFGWESALDKDASEKLSTKNDVALIDSSEEVEKNEGAVEESPASVKSAYKEPVNGADGGDTHFDDEGIFDDAISDNGSYSGSEFDYVDGGEVVLDTEAPNIQGDVQGDRGGYEEESSEMSRSISERMAVEAEHLNNDKTEGVAAMAREAGAENFAKSIELMVESGYAIPEQTKAKKPTSRAAKKKKREEAIASSPVDGGSWWEINGGMDGADVIISKMMLTQEKSRTIEIGGVKHSFFDVDDVMALNEIPATGREKLILILRSIDDFVVSKGRDRPDQIYIGVKTSILENP